MRLIDADALMKKLGITNMDCNECQWGTRYGNICCCCSRGGDFEDACIAIENAPTIEQPQTGHWKPIEDSDCWRGYVCDKCGKAVNQRENFCPNCGARMEKK